MSCACVFIGFKFKKSEKNFFHFLQLHTTFYSIVSELPVTRSESRIWKLREMSFCPKSPFKAVLRI
jgi:hypothetical protein